MGPERICREEIEMTTTLTPFNLTPLGLFHTLVSLVAVVSAFVALYRDKGISPRTTIGRVYLLSLLITTLTGFPIFRHGTGTTLQVRRLHTAPSR
jgi:hypothetical protein